MLDVWRGGMSLRRARLLVETLLAADPTCRTAVELGSPGCTPEVFLLADLRQAWTDIQNPWRQKAARKARTDRALKLARRQAEWAQRRAQKGV